MIGTNKKDAQETVDAMLADLSPAGGAARGTSARDPDAAAIEELLRSNAGPSWSPTPAGRRSTATSARSASPWGARA